MEDSLTKSVIGYQNGEIELNLVRNQVWEAAFGHLNRYQRKKEDEISEFLLLFHGRIEGILERFRFRGLPFRHFLFRTLRWQWHSFQTDRARNQRQDWLVADAWLGTSGEDTVAEPGALLDSVASVSLSPIVRKRLILLALKAAPYLSEAHLEAVSEHSGVDLAWLQAAQHRLLNKTDDRRRRRDDLLKRRGEAFYRRLMAEDEAQRETDPDRRRVHEWRAGLYRHRLENLNREQESLSTAPTHLELAFLLGMPKGSVDSGLYHLKKDLAYVYSGGNDDSARDEQRPQETRVPGHLSRLDSPPARRRRKAGMES